jgi:hypothetical protein
MAAPEANVKVGAVPFKARLLCFGSNEHCVAVSLLRGRMLGPPT